MDWHVEKMGFAYLFILCNNISIDSIPIGGIQYKLSVIYLYYTLLTTKKKWMMISGLG